MTLSSSDETFRASVQKRLDALAKPPGSLGRLEHLAERLCRIRRTLVPDVARRRLVVFAADHGVVAEGVSAWPSSVTRLVVRAIASGVAGSSVLAKSTRTHLRIVDVGMEAESKHASPIRSTSPGIEFRSTPVRHGTRNLVREPALTVDEFRAAWRVGADEAELAVRDGDALILGGEVGIGNTTSAAALARLLADVPSEFATGPGAGADAASLGRKRRVVNEAVARERALVLTDAEAAIAGVCGLEIAALAGCFATAARSGLVVLLDGYVAGTAALVAERLAPGTRDACIAAHLSAEPGHAAVLAALGLEPLLEGWGMRLGEGTGALLAIPLLDAATAMISNMATLDDVISATSKSDSPEVAP
jgi:nicotinate-nucleotide--dimethylbenzimidazole phosphoribosyltransferase